MMIQSYPPFRKCVFCLSLQGGSVFADFDLDSERNVFLRRISFDGYGCCNGDFKKMTAGNSRLLIDAVDRDIFTDPSIEELLRSYFSDHADAIGTDALADHELV